MFYLFCLFLLLSFSSSVQLLSCVRLFATPWTIARQASCPALTARVYSNSCPLNQWCHPTISSSVVPFSSHLQSFLALGSFQMNQVVKVLEFQFQHQSFKWILRIDLLEDGLIGSPCSPRDSQESSPTPQINSSALSFPYSPMFTSIHDYWKNHSFD